jgi:hypothetical protein
MLASLLAVLALAAQSAEPDDGPVRTAPKERAVSADPLPGLDEKRVDIPPHAKPTNEKKTAPAAVAAAKTITVEQKTLVEAGTLQVVIGQRALFRLDDKGQPVLDKVEKGQLAEAHPEGAVTETFQPPPAGLIAAALDGSAEKRATVLKVWNETGKPLDYSAIALIMRQGKVTPEPAPICAVAAHAVRTETWPRPVVAVGLLRFKQTATARVCK